MLMLLPCPTPAVPLVVSSPQDHYDFGMRAVKSVLVMAGALKRANPDLAEDVVLIRCMLG